MSSPAVVPALKHNPAAVARTVADIRRHGYQRVDDPDGDLLIMESGKHVPYPVARVFVVDAHKRAIRGRHAHITCNQLLICLQGRLRVTCDDGRNRHETILDKHSEALLMPSGIWGEQDYLENPTMLMVLCDEPFDASEYIRDYDTFLRFKGVAGS